LPRIGIIGAGGMGRGHAEAYSHIPDVTITGVADIVAERAADLAERCGAKAYPSIETLLDAEKPDIVDICVPTDAHVEVALAACAAGVPTILEKPIARTLAQAHKVVNAFKDAGVPILPAHVVRFFPDYFEAREKAREGVVGQPGTVRLTRGGPQPHGTHEWYMDADRSGGVLIDLMLHDFDWLRWTFGDVERVTASGLMAQGVKGRDYALAVLRMKSGVIAHVEGTWVHTDGFRTEMEIAGDKGVMQYSSQYPFTFRLRLDEAKERLAVPVPESPLLIGPYTAELSELVGALTGGPAARVTIEDGLAALEIGEACWKSAQTGEPVTLPLT
jgi:predicted dehydrogenase